MLIVAWETTAACNLKCSYCRAFASDKPDSDELSTEEAKAFIKCIASLQPMLILSGGEPLLRPDIFQLARYATSLGLRVSLASNGTLITSEVVHQIRDSGISRVSISLDGTTADKHDQNRGIGSFHAAMKGVEELRNNVDFQVNFTITNKNESEVLSIFDLAEAKGAKALHFFFMVPTGRGQEVDLISAERQEDLLCLIDRERMQRNLEVQVTCAPQYAHIAKSKRGGGCLAGRNFVFISRSGDVFPCGYLPLLVGNIRKQKFTDIWENSPLFMALRKRDLKGKCSDCSFVNTCGGCRARAYANSGDFLGPDPFCNLVN
jgi:AdoMet-dependent heme synthase